MGNSFSTDNWELTRCPPQDSSAASCWELWFGALTALINVGGSGPVRFVGLLLDAGWTWCLVGFVAGAIGGRSRVHAAACGALGVLSASVGYYAILLMVPNSDGFVANDGRAFLFYGLLSVLVGLVMGLLGYLGRTMSILFWVIRH